MTQKHELLAWYSDALEGDRIVREQSDGQLGDERYVFASAMNGTKWMLQLVMRDQLNDLPEKAKVLFSTHAYNLLWSAWDSTLCARYDVAMHTLRTVDECLDFIRALATEPNLATPLAKGKLDVNAARETIKNELERLKPGAGTDWGKASKGRWMQHKFAHATLRILGAIIPVTAEGAAIVVPGGGVIDQRRLRSVATALAESALDLVKVAGFGFKEEQEILDWWMNTGRQYDDEARDRLKSIAEEFGFAENPLETLPPEGTE